MEVDILSFYDPDGNYMFTIYRYEGSAGFGADSDQIYLHTTGEGQAEMGQVEIAEYISSYAGFSIHPLKGVYYCVEVYQDLQ